MSDPITFNHGSHWSVEPSCGTDNRCEGSLDTPEVFVRPDGTVEILGWVFDPAEEFDRAYALNAAKAWTTFHDWLKRGGK